MKADAAISQNVIIMKMSTKTIDVVILVVVKGVPQKMSLAPNLKLSFHKN